MVVDSAGNIIGTLDSATGNVVAPDGSILGTLNETTGVVVDSAGNLIGTVTDLVDGASVVGSNGAVLGVLDAVTGNVVDASGNVVGTLDPLTGDVLNTVGAVVGTVTDFVNGTTVLDSAGNVVGTLDGATGNVVNAAGNVIGSLNPLTGQVLDAAGNLVGTVGEVLDDVTDTVGQLDTGDLLKGDLLNVDVNVDLDADLAAPINGAVAANANIAAPIDAAVSANILSEDSESTAIAQQDAIINQSITGNAEATSDQVSDIDQSSIEPVDTDTASADDDERAGAASASQEPATEDGAVAPASPRDDDAGRRPHPRRRRPAHRGDGGLRLPEPTDPGAASRRAGPPAHPAGLPGAERRGRPTRLRGDRGAGRPRAGPERDRVRRPDAGRQPPAAARPAHVLADGSAPELKRSNPLLSLKPRVAVTNPQTTRRLTDPFRVLFRPVVAVAVTPGFVAVVTWVFFDRGLGASAYDAFERPHLLLLVFVVSVLSAGFHEFGHAAAARYSGGQPGAMGAGLYLVWPAFYTDVTDSYRLDRGGRIRTDLGWPVLQRDRRGPHVRVVVGDGMGGPAAAGRHPGAADGAADAAAAAFRRLPRAGRPVGRARPLPPDPADPPRAAAAPLERAGEPGAHAVGACGDHPVGAGDRPDDGADAAGADPGRAAHAG